ncbi:MAG: DUF2064 domain-containing protein [Natronomonas sp.]
MTTIAILADPPRPGVAFDRLAASSVLSADEAAALYRAAFGDVVAAAEACGGEYLINYRPDDAEDPDGESAVEAELREITTTIADEAVRFEPQVGETFAGRVGNTATHLLEQEDAGSVAIVDPSAVFLSRSEIDNAAMKLRRHETVLGPTTDGRVYYAAFTDPIDFADSYDPPAISTLSDRAADADLSVDFLPYLPVVETGRDLAAAATLVETRRKAGRIVPQRFAAWLADADIAVEHDDDGPRLVRP